MKRYQKGGVTPKPDMRSYEEQQEELEKKRKEKEKEKAAAREREAEDAAMDRKMREASKKQSKTPLFKKGGSIDGRAVRGKTRGRMC